MTSPSSLTPLVQHSPLENSPSSLSLLLNNADDVAKATTSSACASPVKRSWSSLETVDSAISKLPHLSPTRRTNKTTTKTCTDDSPIANDIKSPLFIIDKQHPTKEESSSQPYGSSGGTFTTFSLKQPVTEESPLPASESLTSDTNTSSTNLGNTTTPTTANSHHSSTTSTTSSGAIVKPYACTECEQTFCRPHNLKSHQATHSSIRPYKCGTCDKNFRRLHDLKRHEKLHTGEKPYVCDLCSRSFSRLDALNRHQRAEKAARRWSDSDVANRQQQQQQPFSASTVVNSTSSSPSSSSPPPRPLVVSPTLIPNHHQDDNDSSNHFSSDNTTINKQSNDTPSSQLDHPTTTNTMDSNSNNNNSGSSNSNSNSNSGGGGDNGGGKIKKKSIKSLVQGQQHRFRSSRPNIPQINIPNPATKWPPISSTLATIKPTALPTSSSSSSPSSNMTSSSPSPIGSPIILPATTTASSSTATVPTKMITSRHTTTSYGSGHPMASHESSLPTPETAHPLSTTTSSTGAIISSWNHHPSSTHHQLPPPPPSSLNPSTTTTTPTRTVLPPVIRQTPPQDQHHLMSPYSPFTPIASPLSQQQQQQSPSHAVLLQKYRDLETKFAILEKAKTTQQDAMNGKIHDLEVENRLLRSLVADSQRLSNGNGNSPDRYLASRNLTDASSSSPGTM